MSGQRQRPCGPRVRLRKALVGPGRKRHRSTVRTIAEGAPREAITDAADLEPRGMGRASRLG